MDNMYSNPYTSSYAPSTFPQQGQQDQQGLGPVFQNTSSQQQFLANQLREGNGMSQYRGSSGGGSGFNPMNMSKMLRGSPTSSAPTYSYGDPTVQNVSPELDPYAYGTGGGTTGYGSAIGNTDAGMGDFMGGSNMFDSLSSTGGDWLSTGGDWLSGLGDLFAGWGAGAAEVGAEAAPLAAA